ncbi:UNVERIFIED_CONTAM: hypothetical protein K2H54_046336, partial [Gekko kuhli]
LCAIAAPSRFDIQLLLAKIKHRDPALLPPVAQPAPPLASALSLLPCQADALYLAKPPTDAKANTMPSPPLELPWERKAE